MFLRSERSFSMHMSRRAVALSIVLLIAGLAPASAIIGYCARMPCCRHATENPLKISPAQNQCCTTIACYDTPSAKLTANAPFAAFTGARAVASAIVFSPEPQLLPAVSASPPPTTQQRLAILSTLLI